MSVHERIAQAMEVIAAFDFDKSGRVTGGQSYSFIPIGQILRAVRQAHAKAGLFLTTGPLEFDAPGEGYSKTERGWINVRGHCEVTINGADGDSVSYSVPFEVQDNSDKLTNKIITNIERGAYRIIYAIDEGDATDTPPGEDPEAVWVSNAPEEQPTKKQSVPTMTASERKAAENDAKTKSEKMQITAAMRFKCLVHPEYMKMAEDTLKEHGCTEELTDKNFDSLLVKILEKDDLQDLQKRIDELDSKVVS